MSQWVGKVGVVTGAANGIGLAIAQRFGREGMKVVLADYDADALDAAVATLGGDPDRVIGVRTDVSLADDVELLAQRASEHFGATDVLVNNAGVGAYGYTTEATPLATWEWIFGVNLYGAVHGIRSFLPRMQAAGRGHIVNTGSPGCFSGSPHRAAYSASKHALLGLSESLYYELAEAESPVRVSVMIPALIITTIRDSAQRWPARLGPNAAMSPEGTAFSVPMTPEAGALDPSVCADATWDVLQTGHFLASVPTAGLDFLAPRILELCGIDPPRKART